jgi:hypothetical protein
MGLILASQEHQYSINTEGGSLLALVFNRLWCRCLNSRKEGYTHFAMMHADVEAPACWLDKMIKELDDLGADILSTVLPIKDKRGITTTAFEDPIDKNIRRLTMSEALSLPRSFNTIPDNARFNTLKTLPSKCTLLINTGLWVCRVTDPWVDQFPGFHILDAIVKEDDGLYQARAYPEDWNFSRWAAEKGLKVYATRMIEAFHHGRAAYSNHENWGRYDIDPGDPRAA